MTSRTPVILRASAKDFIELSGIEKFGDGSGYKSRLSVGSGGFSCSEHPFYFDELDRFAKNINKAYNQILGKASLGQMFEKSFIEIDVLAGGHVSVAGFIQTFRPERNELHFGFICDQTFLPDFLRSLNEVTNELA